MELRLAVRKTTRAGREAKNIFIEEKHADGWSMIEDLGAVTDYVEKCGPLLIGAGAGGEVSEQEAVMALFNAHHTSASEVYKRLKKQGFDLRKM